MLYTMLDAYGTADFARRKPMSARAKQAISRALKGKRKRRGGGLSTRAKVGIGLGAAAALGGVAGYRRLTSEARQAGNDNIALQGGLKGSKLSRGERRDAYKSGFKTRAGQQVQGVKDSARAYGAEKMRQTGNLARSTAWRAGTAVGKAANAVQAGYGAAKGPVTSVARAAASGVKSARKRR